MKKETLYNLWKSDRRQIQVPDNFAAGVMAEIENLRPGPVDDIPMQLDHADNRLVRWAMATGLVLLGLFRVFYIAVNLIRINPLTPY